MYEVMDHVEVADHVQEMNIVPTWPPSSTSTFGDYVLLR